MKNLFDKSFPSLTPAFEDDPGADRSNAAYFTVKTLWGRYVYSRASTHQGNAVILYHPNRKSARIVAGEIQQIDIVNGKPKFTVKRHVSLSHDVTAKDPFRRYPHFPARCYLTRFKSEPDVVLLGDIVSHGARFDIPDRRTVIVNLSRL